MGAAMPWVGQGYLFASATTTNPSNVCMASVTVAVPNGWTEIPCGSGVEGASGVVMTSGRESPATVEVVVRHDTAYTTEFLETDGPDTFALFLWSQVGTGANQRFVGWFFPALALDAEPMREDKDRMVYTHLKFRALANRQTAGDPLGASSTELSRSPVQLFLA